MDFEILFQELHDPLGRRLRRLLGDAGTAEDVRQEAFARTWTSAPREAGHGELRAWVHRTARNLAIDELRRRRVRESVSYDEGLAPAHQDADGDERIAVREALGRLASHERFLLLLRFEGGLSHSEIGELLGVGEEAARKRVTRAVGALREALRKMGPRERPLVLILAGDEPTTPYRAWIERAGGDPRILDTPDFERQLTTADALVVTGSQTDIHPGLYGEPNRGSVGDLDLGRDRRDLAAVRAALRQDVPFVGVCRGHQLLNIALGGTLYQEVAHGRASSVRHDEAEHSVATGSRSLARRLLGRGTTVASGHHQAAKRIGRGLRPTSTSPDDVVETLELPRRRFALGVQWHPERQPDGLAGARLATALVEAAR